VGDYQFLEKELSSTELVYLGTVGYSAEEKEHAGLRGCPSTGMSAFTHSFFIHLCSTHIRD
jgi:hypothetical protein